MFQMRSLLLDRLLQLLWSLKELVNSRSLITFEDVLLSLQRIGQLLAAFQIFFQKGGRQLPFMGLEPFFRFQPGIDLLTDLLKNLVVRQSFYCLPPQAEKRFFDPALELFMIGHQQRGEPLSVLADQNSILEQLSAADPYLLIPGTIDADGLVLEQAAASAE
jgi:hypothetical protein